MAVPNRVEIPKFPGNKRIAVTASFDDGVETDRPVIERFNAWGLKATWNLNSVGLNPHPYAKTIPLEQIAEVYHGHEVALHTVTHPHLERLDAAQIAYEILDDKKALENFVGYPIRGMAYPCGTWNQTVINVLRALGIVYARTVEKRDHCFPPEESLAWPATAHQFDAGLSEKWKEWYDSQWFNGVFFIWGHSYEFELQKDWAGLERIFKPLAGKKDVWYCTNIELFDYEAARKQIVIAANRGSAYNPSGKTITLLADGRQIEVPRGRAVSLAD
jgi:peptidoglycan/xylan/chitin deacetylase (PgdA/CDA1 family)